MSQHKPAWWQLYAILPLMAGLLLAELFKPLPETAPEIVDVGIVAICFGSMLAWMRINGGLIESEELEKDESIRDLKITVYDPQTDSMTGAGEVDLALPANSEMSIDASPVTEPKVNVDEEKWLLN
jgi:hypothetical protein